MALRATGAFPVGMCRPSSASVGILSGYVSGRHPVLSGLVYGAVNKADPKPVSLIFPPGVYGAREASQGSSLRSDRYAARKERAALTNLPLRSCLASR